MYINVHLASFEVNTLNIIEQQPQQGLLRSSTFDVILFLFSTVPVEPTNPRFDVNLESLYNC